jgi:predicted Ser/Thr protein kinase
MVLGERYDLLKFLGRGGFGRVFRARDRLLDIDCALKFLDPHLTEDEEQVNRFKREILLGRKVRHENACQIFDFGELDGHKFISMEFVDGQSLKDRLAADPPLQYQDLLRIVLEICAALDVAHRQGIVHRDLKLENIMLDSTGLVKVMDFGIAHSADTANMTSSNKLLGTPSYMAPERWRGEDVGTPSDIYALGVLMYQLFTGRPPFDSQEMVVVCFQHINDPPPPALSLNPQLPEELAQIMERCLAKAAGERYADAGELGRALAALAPTGAFEVFLDDRRSAPTPSVATGRRAVRTAGAEADSEVSDELEPVSRRRVGWLVALMALLLGASVGGLAYLLLGPGPDGPDVQPTPAPTGLAAAVPTVPAGPTPDPGLDEARAVAEKLFGEGRFLEDSGELDALRAYQRVLQLQPFDPGALARIRAIAERFRVQGDEAFAAARYEVALEHYSRALKADPGDSALRQKFEAAMERRKRAADMSQLLEDARRALSRFEPQQAEELLDEVQKGDPGHPLAAELRKEASARHRALEALAAAQQKLAAGDLAGVRASLGQLGQMYPDWIEPKELGRELARREGEEQARREAEARATALAAGEPNATAAEGSWHRPADETGGWMPESVRRHRQFRAHLEEGAAALRDGMLNAARAALRKAEALASGEEAKHDLAVLRRAIEAAEAARRPAPR